MFIPLPSLFFRLGVWAAAGPDLPDGSGGQERGAQHWQRDSCGGLAEAE